MKSQVSRHSGGNRDNAEYESRQILMNHDNYDAKIVAIPNNPTSMSKKSTLDQIAAALAEQLDGQHIAELQARLKSAGLTLDRRTLQRRLRQLINVGHVAADGQARARRYRAVAMEAASSTSLASVTGVATAEVYVPLSPPGEQVKQLVRRPITQRDPVSYNRAFLHDYEPNRTFYLSESIRAHLLGAGRSPVYASPAGTYARDILQYLLIDLSWASSRLEGNTYSRLETKNLIELGHAAEGKDRLEAQMILNHKAAIEMLVDNAAQIGMDTFTFFNLHALLAENLLPDPAAAGRLREGIVDIGGSVFRPLAIRAQIDEYFRLLLNKAGAIADPFEQAFFLLVQIPYLQPFVDVNKRVSRLSANIPLIKRNLSPLSFVDVPERAYIDATLGVYELNRVDLLRDVFVWAYARSCRRYVALKDSLAEPDPVRLRNREALIEVVGHVVRNGLPIDTRTIRQLATPRVSAEDLGEFVAMAFSELHHLHEGNLVRYRLQMPQYVDWKPNQRIAGPHLKA